MGYMLHHRKSSNRIFVREKRANVGCSSASKSDMFYILFLLLKLVYERIKEIKKKTYGNLTMRNMMDKSERELKNSVDANILTIFA